MSAGRPARLVIAGGATRSGVYRTQFVRAALDLLAGHEVTVWFLVTPANIVSVRLPHEWPGTRGWDSAFGSPRRLRQRADKIPAGAVAAAA